MTAIDNRLISLFMALNEKFESSRHPMCPTCDYCDDYPEHDDDCIFASLLNKPPVTRYGVAIIHYYPKDCNLIRYWSISADPHDDTAQTLKEHLEKYRPGSVFIKAVYEDVTGLKFTFK